MVSRYASKVKRGREAPVASQEDSMPKGQERARVVKGGTLAYLGDAEAVRYTMRLEALSVALDEALGPLNAMAEDMGRELDKIYGSRGRKVI